MSPRVVSYYPDTAKRRWLVRLTILRAFLRRFRERPYGERDKWRELEHELEDTKSSTTSTDPDPR